MSTTPLVDELDSTSINNPGIQLSLIRQQKGYSIEYVASKLHLRARVIELLENSEFSLLPEPVFVKGYLRAYSKLLGISPEPLIAVFNAQFVFEKKIERALWQSKRESHKAEHAIRWFTVCFAIGVIIAVGLWWQKDNETVSEYSAKKSLTHLSIKHLNKKIKLADISKFQTLLTPKMEMSPVEKQGD